MQMQRIKKVASGALGLFLTGATLMGPALAAADLSDFKNMGPSNTVIVVGANAATADVVGGINIGGKLAQSGIESATCSVSCSDAGSAKVTGGVKIETSSKKLYLGTASQTNSLGAVRSTMSENDLDLLKKETIEYEDGTTTKMNQILELTTNTKVRYSEDDPAGEVDTPRLILYSPSGSTLYNYTMTFPTGLDVRDPDNTSDVGAGIAGQDVTLMGKTFTVGVQNDISSTQLVLFGGGEEKTLIAAGDPVSFELAGETHTIRMTSWTGTGATLKGVFELDGVTYTKAANTAITVDADTDSQVTIKKVEETKVPSAAGGAATEGASSVIFVGSAKLTLKDTEEVKKGDEPISGATAYFSSSGNKINKIVINYKPDEDMTAESSVPYKDPVFGAFDFVLTGMTPSLESSAKDAITLAKNGKKVKLTVPTKDGNTVSANVYEATDTGKFTLMVDSKQLHINSSGAVNIDRNEYLIVSDGEYSNLLQFRTMDTTNNLITLRDLGSGDDVEVSYSGTSGTLYLGSASYSITGVDETNKQIDVNLWATSTGLSTGLIPIVSRNGASVTLMSGASGAEFTQPAKINVSEVDTVEAESSVSAVDLIVNFTTKTTSNDIDDVSFSPEPTYFQTIGDGDVSAGLTAYGTFVKKDTDADTLKLWYPDEQAYVNVYVMKSGVSPPTGTSTGTEVSQTVSVEAPSLGNGISKLDSEVSASDKQSKNLILVGGPAANNLVKDLAADGKTPDKAYWTANLQGKYILQAVEDAFSAGKTAIVVAGWEAPDTRAASLKLATQDVSGAAVSCMDSSCSDFVYPE